MYKKLFNLKKERSALWNGAWGTRIIRVFNNVPAKVLSFVRRNEHDKVFGVFNLSAESQTIIFKDNLHHGKYVDFSTGETVELDADSLELALWGYRIFTADR